MRFEKDIVYICKQNEIKLKGMNKNELYKKNVWNYYNVNYFFDCVCFTVNEYDEK